MSIYATWLSFDASLHDGDCAKWQVADPDTEDPDISWYRLDDRGLLVLDPDATCNRRCGPIRYQASHILPTDADEHAGSVDLGAIPAFVPYNRAGVDCPDEVEDRVLRWLRLSVNDRTVLLDVDQVRQVHETLTQWLALVMPDA